MCTQACLWPAALAETAEVKSMATAYKRILLKLSGEVLAGEKGTGIDNDTVVKICTAVKKVADLGVEVGIVVGGGNFWRGRSSEHMDRKIGRASCRERV